jgi:archaellum component FlaC
MFMSLESRNELEQLEYNIKQLELITQNLSNAIFKISGIEPDDNLSRSSVFLIR